MDGWVGTGGVDTSHPFRAVQSPLTQTLLAVQIAKGPRPKPEVIGCKTRQMQAVQRDAQP